MKDKGCKKENGDMFHEIKGLLLNSFDESYDSLDNMSVDELKIMACAYNLICRAMKVFKEKNTEEVLKDSSKGLDIIESVVAVGYYVDNIIKATSDALRDLVGKKRSELN